MNTMTDLLQHSWRLIRKYRGSAHVWTNALYLIPAAVCAIIGGAFWLPAVGFVLLAYGSAWFHAGHENLRHVSWHAGLEADRWYGRMADRFGMYSVFAFLIAVLWGGGGPMTLLFGALGFFAVLYTFLDIGSMRWLPVASIILGASLGAYSLTYLGVAVACFIPSLLTKYFEIADNETVDSSVHTAWHVFSALALTALSIIVFMAI